MIGYKVCKVVGGEYISAFTMVDIVRYKVGKWTFRRISCGPLALFDTFDHALRFLQCCEFDVAIFECEYKQSKYKKLWNRDWITNMVQRGTLFADKIKLLKRL